VTLDDEPILGEPTLAPSQPADVPSPSTSPPMIRLCLEDDKLDFKRKVSNLEEINDNLASNNRRFKRKILKLEEENTSLKRRVSELEEVLEGVRPFNRDHYAVALRTLIDGVED
jgi:hypothetical protein